MKCSTCGTENDPANRFCDQCGTRMEPSGGFAQPQVAVAEENADTYVKNAIAKARFYARATGLPALADDSGLEVEALAGAPGVLSARYAGDDATDADRRNLLLSELAKTGSQNRRARFGR